MAVAELLVSTAFKANSLARMAAKTLTSGVALPIALALAACQITVHLKPEPRFRYPVVFLRAK